LTKWDKIWKNVRNPTIIGKISQEMTYRIMNKIFDEFPKSYSIIDVGCGSGLTLKYFRSRGFENSIGIDISREALKRCEEKGFSLEKDVFDIDATNMLYEDGSFDIVFSWGMFEHFEDYIPFVKEMIRVSRKFIVLVQPNVHSFYGRILFRLTNMMGRGVAEYPYRIEEFIGAFKSQDCRIICRETTPLREFEVLVFESS